MKYLAAEADARWEAKPRVMEAPRGQEPARKLPLAEDGTPAEEVANKAKADAKDPWARATAQGPGEKWQPTAWDPAAAKKKR